MRESYIFSSMSKSLFPTCWHWACISGGGHDHHECQEKIINKPSQITPAA